MGETGISQAVQAFVADHIESVLQLEVLLLLRGRPGSEFAAADIADELKIDRTWVEAQLGNLCARGLLACPDTTAPRRFRYAPATPELSAVMDDLARAYTDRRVTVISMIFSKPPSPPPTSGIRTFADAFRFRKDNTDG